VMSNTTELNDFPTLPSENFTKKKCKKELEGFHKKLFELQNVFYADARFALLIIFQGVDTSGKDGTIRHVMTSMNPMGVNVQSFKKPTAEELTHDFLWRVYPHFPAKGMIEVFNRSYYEDILVPYITGDFTPELIRHRYQLFNTVEQHLELNNIHVLKFFLHISKEEQVERINERLSKPHKRWKYAKEDKTAAKNWGNYMNVYNEIINECGLNEWYIVPSDKRWYRNYTVAKILTQYLESLQLKFPQGINEMKE